MWRRSELKSQAKREPDNQVLAGICGHVHHGNPGIRQRYCKLQLQYAGLPPGENGNFNDMFNGQCARLFQPLQPGRFPEGWAGGFVFVMILFVVLAGLGRRGLRHLCQSGCPGRQRPLVLAQP
jgi:hypothetical protein